MSKSTNLLVAATKRFVVPTGVAASFALGAALFAGHGAVHAGSMFSSASPLDDGSVAALTSLDRAMEAVTTRVTPSVVNIEVTARVTPDENAEKSENSMPGNLPPGFAQFFGGDGGGMQMQPQRPQIEHGVGSGVIITPDGYIVTNNHVVAGATKIKVTMSDRRVFTGHVIGTDKLTDLAVIKIDANNLPAIAWGDSSKLIPGQTVLAFGSPFGSLRFSVTRGIVSAINRADPFNTDARRPGDFIQTDAAINPGNSGGPLVDAHGELVGINASIISNSGSFQGAGFAIPSQMVQSVSQQLIAHGKVEHGYLGISMNDVTPENAHFFNLKDASGAIVAQVTPDSPASQAGVKQGDVITALNGHKMLDGSSLQVAVSQTRPGEKLALTVMRSGQPVDLNLTVGTYHANSQIAQNDGDGDAQPGQPAHTGKLGLSVADLDANARQQIKAPDSLHGVVIENVRPDSPAQDAGLQPGDVILEVNRKPATTANQFIGAVHQAPQDKDLLLLVWSQGNASYRTLRPADASAQAGASGQAGE